MPVYKSNEPTKNGNIWYFKTNYTDVFGKHKQYKSKKYKTKTDAVRAESAFLLSVNNLATDQQTFSQIAEEMLEDAKPNMKARAYDKLEMKCRHVCEFLGSIRIDKLSVSQYKQFVKAIREKGYSIAYSNDILSTAKRIVKFANKRYNISSSVPDAFDNFKDANATPSEYNIYTPEEFNQFISGCEEIKWIAFFSVLFYTGMRCGEANALQWKDIDFVNHTISINKNIDARGTEQIISSPKTKSSYRVIPIGEYLQSLLEKLREYWCKADHFNDEWFVFGGLRAFPNNTIQTTKKAILKRSNERLRKHEEDSTQSRNRPQNLKEIRIHDFRHSFASMCINELNLPITSISKYLGHENPSITLSVYSHFYKDKLTDMAALIDKTAKIRT